MRTLSVLLVAIVLGAPAIAQDLGTGPLRSPRSTVQTLYIAVNVSHENPRFIKDAAACLDQGGQPAGKMDAGVLAGQLETVLRAAEVDTQRIPEEVQGDTYELATIENTHLVLRRQADGRWLFDRDTVAQIPHLIGLARKQLEAKNQAIAALNVAHEHRSPRATFRTLIHAYYHGETDRMLACMNLEDIPSVARREVGEQLGHKLCQVIFRYRLVVYQDIPDSNYSEPFTWMSQSEGVIELRRLSSGERKGEWVFSRPTVRGIDRLYDLAEPLPYAEQLLSVSGNVRRPDLRHAPELWLREQMPQWSKANVIPFGSVHLVIYELFGYALLVCLGYGLIRMGNRPLAAGLLLLSARSRWNLRPERVRRQLRPVGWFLACWIVKEGVSLLSPDRIVLAGWLILLNPLTWILGTFTIFRVINLIGDAVEARLAGSERGVEVTQMLWPVGSLAFKLFLGLGTILRLMAMFNWDVTAVLAGLGIGGVAFALGAQDTLKNLFGSFTLIADRPFVVGETVQIGEQGRGVVEAVGLRSTSIRTAEDTLLVVPNSNLTTMNITNFGRQVTRQFESRIGVASSTPPDRLTALLEAIRTSFDNQEGIRKGSVQVAIEKIEPTTIWISIAAEFRTAARSEEWAVRESLLLTVLHLAADLNVPLAPPHPTHLKAVA